MGQGEVGGEGGRAPCAIIHVADEERRKRRERTVEMIEKISHCNLGSMRLLRCRQRPTREQRL
eukprot:2733013-Pyramimonas_sp.AAC.1